MNASTIAVVATVSLLFATALRSTLRRWRSGQEGPCGGPTRCGGCNAHCPMANGKRNDGDAKEAD